MKTLTLSGWTQPADALARALPGEYDVFDYSDYASPEASFEGLKKHFAHADSVIAWSMGGQLALRAIAAGALKPKQLTLLGVPWRFVGAEGMGLRTFELFRDNYSADPARTKERFHALVAMGDAHHRRIKRELDHHPKVEDAARWLPWLDELGRHALSVTGFENIPPTLIIHGRGDAIVPHAQARKLYGMLPGATLSVWKDAGHAPHLHDTPRLIQEIQAHRQKHGLA